MLPTIQLDHQPHVKANKINYIWANRILPSELEIG